MDPARPIYTSAAVGSDFLSAAILQRVRGEGLRIDLWVLAAPLLILLLPALIFITALAVLFERSNWLQAVEGKV